MLINHFCYACRDRDHDSKSHLYFELKIVVLTRNRALSQIVNGLEWVLTSMKYQLIFISVAVIIILFYRKYYAITKGSIKAR